MVLERMVLVAGNKRRGCAAP